MLTFDEAPTTAEVYDLIRRKHATDEELLAVTVLIQRTVLMVRPNARLLLTTDRQGRTTHAAIYDAPLLLNHLGQFKPIQQHAPQLLSKRVECKGSVFEALRLQIEFDLWLDCLFFVGKQHPLLTSTLLCTIERHKVVPTNGSNLQ